MTNDQLARFFAKIEKTESCWLWNGSIMPSGYGQFKLVRTESGYAHRASYEHFVGPIPKELQIDHICKIRNCVNPEHLRVVTPQENCEDHIVSVCRNGHDYTPENTYRHRGKKYCRKCQRLSSKFRRQRRTIRL